MPDPLLVKDLIKEIGKETRVRSCEEFKGSTHYTWDNIGISAHAYKDEIHTLVVEFSRQPCDASPKKRHLKPIAVNGGTIDRTTELPDLKDLNFKSDDMGNILSLQQGKIFTSVSMKADNTGISSTIIFIDIENPSYKQCSNVEL